MTVARERPGVRSCGDDAEDQSSDGFRKMKPAPRKIALDFTRVRKNTVTGLISTLSC
jgi:hypothetical protein